MKSVTPGLAAHLAGEVTTLATCWRVQRVDGALFGFTDHDRNLVVEGLPYVSSSGYARAAIASRADLSVDDTELAGILHSDLITERDLRAGLWDGAEVRIFLINWANLSQGVLRLRRGRIGEVIAGDDGSFRAELCGLAQALQQQIGEQYSSECRADLGDARCRLPLRPAQITRSSAATAGTIGRVDTDLAAVGSLREQGRIYECTTAGTTAGTAPTFDTTLGATTTDGTVVWTTRPAWTLGGRVQASSDPATIQAEDLFNISSRVDDWFVGGVLTMETGANAGVSRDVLFWVQATRVAGLFLPMPFPIAVGDVFRIQPGCDKRLTTCHNRFDNKVNFRGEPHVPGGKAMAETPL